MLKLLFSSWIETPLGSMLAICDEDKLYLLEFVNRRGLENEILRLRKRLHAAILPEKKDLITILEKELNEYFNGMRSEFTIDLFFLGSDFQKQVWKALMEIPIGTTKTYIQLSTEIGNKSAYRAVANANGCNTLSILVPCHRIINANGELGGYGGGLARKEWLLSHEANMK